MRAKKWKFDKKVAEHFDEIALTNIPHYEEVVEKCLEIAKRAFPDKKRTKIIDVGSATGYTMRKFIDQGYVHVYGVDSSESMLDKSRVKKNLILSNSFPRNEGPFHLVLANWTLHFIQGRERYISDISDSLKGGGILILSEKMSCSQLVHERYHDFKKSMGVSEKAIRTKERQLRGVLVPRPLEWYLKTLRKSGFKSIEIIDSAWCFNTLLCRK